MKKIISLILSIVMLMTLAIPAAYAVETEENEATPIIFLRGNGEAIHYENGEGAQARIDIGEVLGDESIYDTQGMVKEIVNILIPFLTRGMLKDDWDECRKAIYNAISPFFQQSISDGDGNAQMGTTISAEAKASNEKAAIENKDYYGAWDAVYHYDWRRDPYDNVEDLHAFVLKIIDNSGKKQVSFVSRCLGGTLLNVYLKEYGHLGHVKNVLYGDTLGNGSTVLSKLFSGKIEVDGKNLQRYQGQLGHCAEVGQGVGIALPELINEILVTTLDLLTQTGVTDSFGDGFENLYDDLLQMLLPALMHAIGYASTPNYWACVRDEDFDEALTFMFGEEGSEARVHFAGLITKITNYREEITRNLPKLYKTFSEDYGINIATVSKYGYLNMPVIEDNDILSDSLASMTHASFGATCAKVGETLEDSYIASKVAQGKGDYISPDKQVDMSTAMFPETSWVIKNYHHGFAGLVLSIAEEFCNGTGVTIETSKYPRFMMCDERTGNWTEMTEDNCGDFEFMTLAETEPDVSTKLAAGLRFLTMIFNIIVKLLKGEISFSGIGAAFGK